MRRKLLLSDGVRERELQLVGRIVVGRDPTCEISHDDSLLSRRHAEFVTSADVVRVRDLGSRNGVFVNGARAAERVLAEGDVIQIGPLRARFFIDRAAPGISPEEIDGDRTAVIRKVFAAPVPGAGAETGLADDTDEDATRLVPAPSITGDDGPTMFVSVPPPGSTVRRAAATTVLDLPIRPIAAPAAASRVPVEKALRTAVFVQLLVLSTVVVAAATLLQQTAPLSVTSLALCAAVVLIASAVASASIGRRVGRALDEIGRAGR